MGRCFHGKLKNKCTDCVMYRHGWNICAHDRKSKKCEICIRKYCYGWTHGCTKCNTPLCCNDREIRDKCANCDAYICTACHIKGSDPKKIYCNSVRCVSKCEMCNTWVCKDDTIVCNYKHAHKFICGACAKHKCSHCNKIVCDCVCCRNCKEPVCHFDTNCMIRCEMCEWVYCYDCKIDHQCILRCLQPLMPLPVEIFRDIELLVSE